MRLNDDDYVREQYRTTEKLEVRSSVWRPDGAGTTPQDVALEAVRQCTPQRVLEVGAGKGVLARRIRENVDGKVIATDSSPAMVAACREWGVDAIEADVRDLPFESATFDVVVAAWMLYHVEPLGDALAEIARVLRPSGRLVAVTNGRRHLDELWRAVGEEHGEPAFSVENGAARLLIHFSSVTQRDIGSRAVFPHRATAAAYLRSLNRDDLVDRLPLSNWPLEARGSSTVFVADDPRRFGDPI